jgi:hypothetical protein
MRGAAAERFEEAFRLRLRGEPRAGAAAEELLEEKLGILPIALRHRTERLRSEPAHALLFQPLS